VLKLHLKEPPRLAEDLQHRADRRGQLTVALKVNLPLPRWTGEGTQADIEVPGKARLPLTLELAVGSWDVKPADFCASG
jgi:hypothetical protein